MGGDKETQVCCRLVCLRVSQEVANARLLSSVQKATSYLQEEIPRLIKNCLKSHQRSRRSTLEIIQYGPCQMGRNGND